MQCICGEPLLQKEIMMYSIPELVFDPNYKEEPTCYKYRSAKAGPSSPVLTNCPACGVLLSSETVKEIKD